MTRQEIMLNEYRNRIEVADNVLSETRAKLTKAEHDRDRYKAEIERLKAQQREIDGLKAEDERLREVIRQLNTEYNRAWERLKSDCREIGELKAENKQLKTECALLDDELRIARQDTIDVLNELKERIPLAMSKQYVCAQIDKMIEELVK